MAYKPAITIDSVSVSFSDGFKALDNVSLTVPSGRITGLIALFLGTSTIRRREK